MIVISKKRILAVIGCVFVCIFVITCIDGKRLNEPSLPTVSLPVTNKVIVLDAGHGVPDERS